ncbi:MAG: hypothetical protein Fur0042_02120 [Cyanophyceae cyanobacterium]
MDWTSPLEFQQQDFLRRWQASPQHLSDGGVPHCHSERLRAPMSSGGDALQETLRAILPPSVRIDRLWPCTTERRSDRPVGELAWSMDAALVAGASVAVCLARDEALPTEWIVAGFVPLVLGLGDRTGGSGIDGNTVRADRLLYGGGLAAYLQSLETVGTLGGLQRLVASAQHVEPLTYSADGRLMACSCNDGRLRVWRVEVRRLREFSPSPFGGVGMPSARPLVRGTGRLWRSLPCPAGSVRVLAFSAASDRVPVGYLASGTYGGLVTVWDLEGGRAIATLQDPSKGVDAIAVSADGTYLATAALDSKVRLWDLAARTVRYAAATGPHGVSALAFSPHQPWLAVGDQTGAIAVWERDTGYPISQFAGHTTRIDALTFGEEEATLHSESVEPVAKTWKLPRGTLLNTRAERPQGSLTLEVQPEDEGIDFEIFAP